jgi:hypothetical protein
MGVPVLRTLELELLVSFPNLTVGATACRASGPEE